MADQSLESSYEHDINLNPSNITNWISYLDFKTGADFISIRQPLYDRALVVLPRSYKLWHRYLTEYETYAIKFPITNEIFSVLNTKFEEALLLLERMPLIWVKYLKFLLQQPHLITHTRTTFNRALQQLAITQHLEHIWPLFLQFAQSCPSQLTKVAIWERYLAIAPESCEDFITALVEAKNWDRAALEYQKILTNPRFVSLKGKSKYELWSQLLSILVSNGSEIKSIRPEDVIRAGLVKYTHEAAQLWCSLAKMYISGGFMTQARDIYLEALNSIVTLKDFNIIYDAYMRFEEALAQSLDDILTERLGEVEQIDRIKVSIQNKKKQERQNALLGIRGTANTTSNTTTTQTVDPGTIPNGNKKKKGNVNPEDNLYSPFQNEKHMEQSRTNLCHEIALLEREVELAQARITHYINSRDLFINNTLLRQNPNNINEWFVRTKLIKDPAKVSMTFQQALQIVDPSLAIGRYQDLWTSLANLFQREGQLDDARRTYEAAIMSTQQSPEAMVYLWCKYAEMEIFHCHQECEKLVEAERIERLDQYNRSQGLTNLPSEKNYSFSNNNNNNDNYNDNDIKEDGNDTDNDNDQFSKTNYRPSTELTTNLQIAKRNAYIRAKNILDRATNLRITELRQSPPPPAFSTRPFVHTPEYTKALIDQLDTVTKSVQIWSFYVDLTECTCSLYYTKHVYQKMFAMKIHLHSPSLILQYISLLLEHNYIEESFTLYEQAIKDLSYPTVGPVWLSYLHTFLKYNGESKPLRTRDLFETAISVAPEDHRKTLYLLFARYEEQFGTPRRLLQVLQRACKAVPKSERHLMYAITIVKMAQNYGLAQTRPLFQEALGQVNDTQLESLGLQFIRLEVNLKQYARARAIFQYMTKSLNPKDHEDFWDEFSQFETQYGTVETFKAYSTLKRNTKQYFADTALYRRALAAQEKEQANMLKEKKELELKKQQLKKKI